MVKKNRHGIILLEALFALMIFSVGVTVCVKSMLTNVRAVTIANDYFYALQQIDNAMLDYLQKGFVSDDMDESKQLEENQVVYALDVHTQPIEASEQDSSLNKISLQMTWAKGSKKNKIELVSYVYKDPEK